MARTAKNVATNVVSSTLTTGSGDYTIPQVEVGEYTVTVEAPGFKTHISQVYLPDDPNIETDVQFGVTKRLLGDYVRHENEKPPAPGVKDPWFSLDYTFIMEPGTAKLPRPPIQDKAVSTTGASVESTIRGAVDWVANRDATCSMSATPSAPV